MSFGDTLSEETKRCLTDLERGQIITQISEYLSGVDDILLGYLYGSFPVRNDFHDIDIGLLVSGKMEPYESLRHAMDIASGLEQCITPRFEVDCRILNGAPVTYLYEVVKTGRAVYVRDEKVRIDFEADVTARYLDFKPPYDRMDNTLPEHGCRMRIQHHMQELQDALADWKRYQSIPREDFLSSRDTRNMVFHAMMVAIQSAIDVATDIIAEERFQKPATYRETFEILGKNGILAAPLVRELSALAGFRNVLVHIYCDLDFEQVYEVLQRDLGSLEDFSEGIREYLS